MASVAPNVPLDEADEENDEFRDLNSHPSTENSHGHIRKNPGKENFRGRDLGVMLGMEELQRWHKV